MGPKKRPRASGTGGVAGGVAAAEARKRPRLPVVVDREPEPSPPEAPELAVRAVCGARSLPEVAQVLAAFLAVQPWRTLAAGARFEHVETVFGTADTVVHDSVARKEGRIRCDGDRCYIEQWCGWDVSPTKVDCTGLSYAGRHHTLTRLCDGILVHGWGISHARSAGATIAVGQAFELADCVLVEADGTHVFCLEWKWEGYAGPCIRLSRWSVGPAGPSRVSMHNFDKDPFMTCRSSFMAWDRGPARTANRWLYVVWDENGGSRVARFDTATAGCDDVFCTTRPLLDLFSIPGTPLLLTLEARALRLLNTLTLESTRIPDAGLALHAHSRTRYRSLSVDLAAGLVAVNVDQAAGPCVRVLPLPAEARAPQRCARACHCADAAREAAAPPSNPPA